MSTAAGQRLKLRVAPGARRPGLVGRHGDAWKVRIAEPPEDGRANEAVMRVVADALGIPRRSVKLVAGHASRDKVVAIDADVDAEALLARAAGKERG